MIDLRSDTVTTPSDAMREAAATAEVGDDVYGEDPSVNELEEATARLLGTEAALFCASGTMANQIAAKTQTEPGQEVLVEVQSHVYKWELGGLAQHAGLQTRPIDASPRGAITPEQVRHGHVEEDLHRPGTGLLVLENTHNSRGGTALSPDTIDKAARTAHDLGVPVHLDGARLANAAIAHDVRLDRFTREVDSVMLSLSKGLGAPVGSLLAGSNAFIDRARRVRKLFGGAMRQAGILAAPGLLALENVGRLGEDHDHASRLAAELAKIPGLGVADPETNIVLVETVGTGLTSAEVLERWEAEGVLASPFGDDLIRLCTHLDVDGSAIEQAVEGIEAAMT